MCIWIDVCLRHLLLLCECASLCSVMRLNVPIFECLDGGHVACLINFTSLSFSTARAQAGSNRNSRKERKRKNVYRTMVLGRRRRRRRTERRKEEKKCCAERIAPTVNEEEYAKKNCSMMKEKQHLISSMCYSFSSRQRH